MRRQLVAAVRMLVVLTVLTGVAYPLVVTALAQTTMPIRADGSLIRFDGRVVGSSLLGQGFTGPQWFHPRPGSYDPTSSGPTNLGPTNPKLLAAVRARFASVGGTGSVPADAVTSSASGLDPDISPAYARLQISRVAASRGIPASAVLALVDRMTAGRTFGVLGEPRVNVLLLNLALARLASGP